MSKLSSKDLMNLHLKGLYVYDKRYRMLSINQWDGGEAPRFFLGRTQTGNHWRFHADLPDELAKELATLCAQEPHDLSHVPKYYDQYLELLESHAPIKSIWRGPAYSCQAVRRDAGLSVHISPANAYLLKGGLDDWLADVPYRQPFMASLEDGKAVAVCSSVRITELAHEAGVETLAAYRRKGHATTAIKAWVNDVLSLNLVPLYSTSFDNIASMTVAENLGFNRFGTDFHIT